MLDGTLVISECRNHSGGDSVVLGGTLVISECRNYSGGDSVVLGSTLVPHTYPHPPSPGISASTSPETTRQV